MLSRHLPESELWERYRSGEHAAGCARRRTGAPVQEDWGGAYVVLKRLLIGCAIYAAVLNSENSIGHRTTGFGLRTKANVIIGPLERWPSGSPVVSKKIRRIKAGQSELQLFASITGPQSETEDILPASVQSNIVQGRSALKRLNDLPQFAETEPEAVKAWQAFIRCQVLTQKQIVTEFEKLYSRKETKKLDGAVYCHASFGMASCTARRRRGSSRVLRVAANKLTAIT